MRKYGSLREEDDEPTTPIESLTERVELIIFLVLVRYAPKQQAEAIREGELFSTLVPSIHISILRGTASLTFVVL